MKYLGLGYYDPAAYADLSQSEQKALGEPCAPLDEEFRATGQVRAEASLAEEGRIFLRPAGSGTSVTDGPFAEAKEGVGGYWIIDVDSKEEAVEWAKRCPGSENEVIEIRQIQEVSDCSDEVQEIVEDSLEG